METVGTTGTRRDVPASLVRRPGSERSLVRMQSPRPHETAAVAAVSAVRVRYTLSVAGSIWPPIPRDGDPKAACRGFGSVQAAQRGFSTGAEAAGAPVARGREPASRPQQARRVTRETAPSRA